MTEIGPLRGRAPRDHRRTLDAVFWITRAGPPWPDLPEQLGNWNSMHPQYRRWTATGLWDLLDALGMAGRQCRADPGMLPSRAPVASPECSRSTRACSVTACRWRRVTLCSGTGTGASPLAWPRTRLMRLVPPPGLEPTLQSQQADRVGSRLFMKSLKQLAWPRLGLKPVTAPSPPQADPDDADHAWPSPSACWCSDAVRRPDRNSSNVGAVGASPGIGISTMARPCRIRGVLPAIARMVRASRPIDPQSRDRTQRLMTEIRHCAAGAPRDWHGRRTLDAECFGSPDGRPSVAGPAASSLAIGTRSCPSPSARYAPPGPPP